MRSRVANQDVTLAEARAVREDSSIGRSGIPGQAVAGLRSVLFHRWLPLGACLLIAGVIALEFLPVLKCSFLLYDDPDYVTSNVQVRAGLSWPGLRWALSSSQAGNWHPLTWLSHMLDCQMYGLNPRGHHLTNLLFHCANVVLVFVVLRGITGSTGRSLVVAALFGAHPIHVESVAWVAERKDVLSTFFFLLTIWGYSRFAKNQTVRFGSSKVCQMGGARRSASPTNGEKESLAMGWYFLAIAFFALGLASKAMLVTMPFVLLLLDFWPLKRFQLPTFEWHSWRAQVPALKRVVGEKIPFFALSAVCSAVIFVVQKQGGAMEQRLPFGWSLANVPVSYCRYLGKLFWPVNLSIFYPWVFWATWQIVLAGAFIAAISCIAFALRRRSAYFTTGWFWFLGTLVPVIGIVQVGGQSMADRYMYIPSIGILVLVVWGVYDVGRRWHSGSSSLAALAGLAVLACIGSTRTELGYWRDGEALFRHALSATGPSWTALTTLALTLKAEHKSDEAIPLYLQAIKLRPQNSLTRTGLGTVLFESGRFGEAQQQFEAALALKPRDPLALNSLGAVLFMRGNLNEAVIKYEEALQVKPDYALAHYNLATAFGREGRTEEAIREYETSLKLDPNYVPAEIEIGKALAQRGLFDKALREFQKALMLEPGNAEAHRNVGKLLVAQGRLDGAIDQYQAALRTDPRDAETHCGLAAILASTGKIDEAIREYKQTIELRPGYAMAHVGLGTVLARKGPLDEAIDQYRLAVRCEPTSTATRCALGHLLVQKGLLDEAIQQYGEAVRLDPGSSSANYFLGGALAERGDTDRAIAQFKEVLRIQPNNADAHNDLGRALDAKGELDEAIAHLKQAVALDPANPETHNNLGTSLAKTGKLDEAVAQFRESLRLKPDHAGAQHNLSAVLAAKGETLNR